MEDQNPANNKQKAWANDLVTVKKEVEERKEKVPENEAHADPKPARTLPRVGIDFADGVPEGLLGNVGAVNEEILGKADVGPEDGKG